jgi:hypothetical protein
MGPVCVMERSVAAGQAFELAGLERSPAHTANWVCHAENGTGESSVCVRVCVCVCVCARVCMCGIREHPVKHALTEASSPMSAHKGNAA